MELFWSTEDDAFRQRLRAWLAANLPGFRHLPSEPTAALAESRRWQRALFDAGFVGVGWPREFGGQGAPVTQQAILSEELARAGAPPLPGTIGLMTLGPALVRYGSEDQRRRFLPGILTGEHLWCQGFSEPGAGSDLSALRTRAELHGDEFVVSGQKVWTSLAAVADWCFLLARTDPSAPPRQGISYLLMDMRSSGVRIVPIRQITGKRHFAELFLDEVRIPRANVVGELHGGWAVAKATLGFERSGLSGIVELERHLTGLTALARARGVAADPVVRQQIAQLRIDVETLRYTGYRVLTHQARGRHPGAAGAIGKLAASELRRRIMDEAMALQGPFAAIGRGNGQALDRGRWQGLYLDARAYTIGGGTSEIMRNVIAEQVLGLPRSQEERTTT